MTERYDAIAAEHYAAYRPPLHKLILGRVLSDDESFSRGLDVGCGTGYSAAALADYCTRVYGIDPSPSMLTQAMVHERVFYLGGAAERIPLPDGSVDVVTFAGSLSYADSDSTRDEIRRVCRRGAVIVVYDFEALLGEVLRRCGIDAREGESNYNHRANFSAVTSLTELAVGSERVTVEVTSSELAHVLLSDSSRFDQFAKKYRAADPFVPLTAELRSADDQATIEADLYYSKYQVR
jgi:ubiquinone/menaquinone biosynthesis C-methylase UbiE